MYVAMVRRLAHGSLRLYHLVYGCLSLSNHELSASLATAFGLEQCDQRPLLVGDALGLTVAKVNKKVIVVVLVDVIEQINGEGASLCSSARNSSRSSVSCAPPPARPAPRWRSTQPVCSASKASIAAFYARTSLLGKQARAISLILALFFQQSAIGVGASFSIVPFPSVGGPINGAIGVRALSGNRCALGAWGPGLVIKYR
jgi:hypothetical protein